MSAKQYKTRLYLEVACAEESIATVEGDQHHYVKHVLRLSAGEHVAVFNGRDGEWLAKIVALEKRTGSLRLVEQLREQPQEPDIWLVFAPIKHGRIDFLAQKATELGVSRLVPVFTERTAVTRVNQARLQANAIEAAEQSGRCNVPEVAEAQKLEQVLTEWDSARRVLFCDESGGGEPIAEVLGTLREEELGPWSVVIGPEGGFSERELAALHKLPYVTPVGLGPRILRADTAALAALSCWQAFLGDWHHRPTFTHDD